MYSEIRFHIHNYLLKQRSPTFLAPGTGFMEDNFSTDGGGGGGDDSGGNVSDGKRWGAADEALLARRSPPAVWPGS